MHCPWDLVEIQKLCPGISVSENLNTLHRLGKTYFDLGNLQKAKEYILKFLEMEKSFHGDSSPGAADTLHCMGWELFIKTVVFCRNLRNIY